MSLTLWDKKSEFNMLVTQLNTDSKEKVKAIRGPSIMFVTNGSGIMRAAGKEVDLNFGYIFFIGQGLDMEFETKDEKMMVYRAYAE